MQQHIPCSFIKQEKFTYIIVSMLVFLCNNKNSQNKHKTNLESILFHNLSQTRSLIAQKFALDPVLSLLSTISSNLLGFFAFWTVKEGDNLAGQLANKYQIISNIHGSQ